LQAPTNGSLSGLTVLDTLQRLEGGDVRRLGLHHRALSTDGKPKPKHSQPAESTTFFGANVQAHSQDFNEWDPDKRAAAAVQRAVQKLREADVAAIEAVKQKGSSDSERGCDDDDEAGAVESGRSRRAHRSHLSCVLPPHFCGDGAITIAATSSVNRLSATSQLVYNDGSSRTLNGSPGATTAMASSTAAVRGRGMNGAPVPIASSVMSETLLMDTQRQRARSRGAVR